MEEQINGMSKARNQACLIVDIFEDFLAEKGIEMPNKERDEDADGDLEGLATLFGSDYYHLEDQITEIIGGEEE